MATAWRTYSSELSQLAVMREFVGETCRQEWPGPEDESIIFQLQVVLTEAAANVIRHAYQGQSGQPIELMLETHADQVSLTLYYHGPAFDPRTVSPPEFDGSREGGFGTYIIEQSVDQVSASMLKKGTGTDSVFETNGIVKYPVSGCCHGRRLFFDNSKAFRGPPEHVLSDPRVDSDPV